MKISGLASGLDTESIIKDLMNVQRIPLTKVTQKKQTLEWQLDSYRTVNRKVKEFSTNAFNNMILSTKFNAKKTETSAPNDVTVENKNSTSDFSGTIKIEQLAKNSTLQSDVIASGAGKPGSTTMADLGITGDKLTVNAIDENGKMQSTEVTIDSKDTIQNVMDRITKQTGVNAFYDANSGKIALSSKNGGANKDGSSEIAITSTGDAATKLGLAGKTVDAANKGQNAIYTVNGLKMESSKNTVDVNGFTFTLKAANNTEISFSSKPDTDAIFDNVVKFVDDYNKLMEELNGLVGEKKYRDYKPLSAEEKADMSDKEIELWEEKAKSGLLKGDPLISGLVSKMRTALMGSVKDQGSLKDIGIATPGGENAWKQNGKLAIDEEKLKKAINADPEKVHKMFAQGNASTTAPDGEKGFAVRLRAIAESSYTEIHKRAGGVGSNEETFTLGRNLKDMNKQMDRIQDRLKLVEARYWKQFNAMENAIQRANSQSASLMSALGGGA